MESLTEPFNWIEYIFSAGIMGIDWGMGIINPFSHGGEVGVTLW
jgi:hypothetical protein